MKYYQIPTNSKRFEDEFPGWAILVRTVTEKIHPFSVVNEILGVTKSQVDYWTQKGVLISDRKKSSKWRRYSIFDILMIAIVAEFKSRGIEIGEIAIIRDLLRLPQHCIDPYNDLFVYIINGYDVYLFTDFNRSVGTIPIMEEEIIKDTIKLNLYLTKDASFFAAISLKKLFDKLAPKLELPNFKIKILPDGKYKFIVNGVPLQLESLEEEDTTININGEGG
ncbi:MerR family transcriptional regulator [Deltaproteobacteria bacterium]|nr:MerR family transcriptional regulator [Deltaproteobacteria bacterium]